MLRIAFCGKMGSGKTEASEHLISKFGGITLSFAKPLKDLANELFGYLSKRQILEYSDKTITGRQLLQMFGNKMREIDPDIWIHLFLESLEQNKDKDIYVDDLRFNNEEHILKDNGFTVVYIDSDEKNRKKRIKKRDNKIPDTRTMNVCGETTLFNEDIEIFNNSTLKNFYNDINMVYAMCIKRN